MNKTPDGFQEWKGIASSPVAIEGFQEWNGGALQKPEQSPSPISAPSQPRANPPASVDEFVQQITPIAQRIAQKIGAPLDAVIGQLGLETGWGKSVIPGTNNYGNIKDTSGKGVAATDNMNGSRDRYRQYASAEEFADDYAKLVGTNPRYKGAVGAKDAQGFFTGLKQGGYAEDPNYVQSGVAASRTAAESLKKAGFKQESASLPDMTGIPKWSEISTTDKYAKLPDAEKVRMKNAYFDELIAPYVSADGLDVAAEKAKFIGVEKKEDPGLISRASDAAAGVFKAMNPFSATPGLMDGVSQTVRQENTDRFSLPLSAATRAKLDYQYERATPEQRAQLSKADGVVGMYFTERNKQHAERDKLTQFPSELIFDSAFADIGDPRFEARTRQLIRSGMTAEGATTYARTEMQMGMTPGGIKPGSATESDFDFELQDRFKNAPTVIRGAVKGYQGYKQGSLGILQAAADAVGADELSEKFAKGSKDAQGAIDAVGENKNKAGQMFEGAITSIAQQMPSLIGGALTGSEALALGSMAVQSFGQEYAQGRMQNLNGGDAAKRASLFAAFEVVGEKFGLGNTLKALRMSAAGAPTKDLAMELSKALLKEIPGEVLTTTGQFATDKVGSFGLNKEAGMAEYLSQVGDTIGQTVMQSALMMGGTGGVSTTARHLQNRSNNGARLSEIYANDARDRALSKWESNPLVRPTQSPQVTQSPQAAPQLPQAHPTEQVADSVVRDLAALAGMDVEALIPQPQQPAPGDDPIASGLAPADTGLSDQTTSPESRELELWLKSSDGSLTQDEQAELDQIRAQPQQEQTQDGIQQWPAPSSDVATQGNDVQSADVQRSDGDQRRDVGEGQRPDSNAETSLPSDGEAVAVRDEGPDSTPLTQEFQPVQEQSNGTQAAQAQQTETQGTEQQQVPANADAGLSGRPDASQREANQQPVAISRSRPLPDDLLGLLNASGGISANLKSDIDQDARGRPGLYRAAGRNVDEIGALMAEHGYITPDQAGDSETVLEMLRRAVGGERIMTAQGMENARAKEEAARYRADLVTQAKQLGINPVGKNIEKLAAVIEQEVAQRNAISEARRQSLIQESAEAERAIDDVLAMFGSGSPAFKWLADKFAEVSQRETSDQRKSGYDSLVRATRQAIKKWYADQARIDAVIEKSMEDGYGSTENPFGQGEGVTEQIEPVTAAEGDGSGSVRRSDASREGFALEAQTEQSLAEKVAREGDQALADKQTADAQREGFTLSAQTAPEVRTENNADMFGEASAQDIQKGKEIERERQLASGQSANADLFSSPESKPDQEAKPSQGKSSDQSEDVLGMVNQERAAQETPATRDKAPTKQPETARAEQESSAEMDALKAEMGQAIGELASILNVKMNLTPEEESRIIPVMSKIFRIAAKMGYVKFKDAARHVIGQIRQIGGDELANKLSIDNLQAGYINIAKEIGGDKREALAYDSIEELESEGAGNEPVQRSNTDLERNSQDAGTADGMGAQGVRAGRRGDDGAGEQGFRQTETSRRPDGGISVPGYETAPAGELGDYEVLREQAGTEERSSGSADRNGSDLVGYDGPPIEPDATGAIAKAATSGSQVERNREAQRSADKNANTGGTLEDIRAALPSLLPGQQEDVFKAEQRFSKPDGYGMLFTNGTGTGKTFTGLGVIKRFSNRGQHNILIAAPSDQVISAWVASGRHLGLTITQLADTNDAGSGIVITTYANLGDNAALASRQWDLVVADEAHKMMQSEDGEVTNALQSLRAISYHPGGIWRRMDMVHGKFQQELAELSAAVNEDNKIMNGDYMAEAKVEAHERLAKNEPKLDRMNAELKKKQDAMKEEFAAKQGEARSRALFLSATPFAYEKAIDWAEGYLFSYGPEVNSGAYNSGGNYERFMMQHFGYRMRYNKLTRPEGAVDSGLMQRQFNAWLKTQGVLSGRMLDVEPDYDRRFIIVESAIGHRIDEALEWIRETKLEGSRELQEKVRDQFDYQSRRYLLEAVKANEVIEHVKEHMALGRKVVVFHDYKKGGAFHPFRFNANTAAENEFNAKFADLVRFDFDALGAPIETFKRELPGVLLFNGSESAKDRRAAVAKFQDDASGPQVILVQTDAGKEGISLHDTTGKHQRVLFNLGQPTAPTTAIQQEGRIYRTGQATDAIMRYLTTGTDWEKWAFATTIATRASAAENLGMGEAARALKDAFITAYEEADDYRAGHEDEGKGGKERDKLANEALTQFDRARSFYFGQQKKTSKTKAAEGADYFATPEPLGLKMVEWADLRSGEDALEPSAGHGAIARWLPDHTNRTAIEPSGKLLPRLAMVFDGKMEQADFESLHINNKYDAIVMNPPFGSGGLTAVDHVAKAATHLRDGGRIVALIPTGPAADRKFDQWFNSVEQVKIKAPITVEGVGDVFIGDTVKTRATWAPEGRVTGVDRDKGTLMVQTKPGSSRMVTRQSVTDVQPTGKRTREVRPAADLYLAADIRLPSVTFERAGTIVMTRVVVIEKQTNAELAAKIQQQNRDYSSAENIGEFFERIEHANLTPRVKPAPIEEEQDKAAARPAKTAQQIDEAAKIDRGDAKIVEHVTGKGKTITGIIRKDLTLAQAKEIDPYTFKKDGGFFIRDKYLKESSGPLFSLKQESKTPEQIAREFFGNPNPKSTVEQVTKELAGEGSLGDNIQVIQSALDLPPDERRQVFKASSADIGLEAVFFPESGKTYIIADYIEPGKALAALMHDGGVHAGLYGMIGERGINSLAAQIKDWSINSASKEEGRIAKLALARIPESTSPNHKNEEVVAYFITEAVNAGHGDPKPTRSSAISRWFARLWKMVESAITKLGANPSSLTVDDVVALARGALERVKSGDIDPRRTQNDPMESRSSKYSPEQNEFRKKAGIGARPTIRQKLARWAEGMKESISWQAFRQGALDQFHGIKLAEMATIGALPVEQSAYVTARLATGASSVMAGLLGHGQARWAANGQHLEKIPGTKGLLDVLKPVEGQLDDFLGWMVATRASRLMKEGRENNFTQEDIQAGLSLANGKEDLFKQVAKDFADFKRSVLDIAEQAGLIDPAGRKVWDHADWIPFYRQMQDDTTKAPGGKRGLSKQSSGIRQLKGGESAINDPLENILLNFQHLIDASLKNNALRKVIGNIEGRGNSDEFLQSVGYGMQGALIPRDQIKKQLIAAGTPQQMIDALPAEALFGMAKMWALRAPDGKDIIRVMENGKPHFYRVTDPLLLKAVTSFEPFNIPGLATMRAFKRLLTRSVTATPAFMARNFIRDSASSAIISRDRSAVLGALRGVVKSYTESGGYETMMFAGASFAGGQTDGADPESTAKAMRRELRKKGFSASSADEFMASILDKLIKLWDAYSQIGEAIENANREAMYEAAKRSGKSDTAASFEALDLMDFRLRGSHAAYQLFADIIPFVNARIQGVYRLGRSDMKQVAVRGGLFLMIPSVLLALANAGNDEYEELPDWDKDTYWHFFVGGKHFRLPKPFEVGVMFGTIPERITRASLGNDSPKKLASRVWFNIAEQFNLVQWPQFMKPAIEVAMNEDGFSKRPIETIGDKAMIPSMRASYYTSDTMKAMAGLMPGISDATGMSPKRLQHLWNGYLGSVGSAVLGLADLGVRKVQGQPARESMRKDEYPLLGIFYRENPAKNSRYVEEIYKMAQESAELKKSFDAARKAQNKERADEILADNKDKIKSAEMLGHAAASMSSSSKKIEAIRKNQDLTQDQKREQIDAVIKRRNEIAEKVARRAITAWGGSI